MPAILSTLNDIIGYNFGKFSPSAAWPSSWFFGLSSDIFTQLAPTSPSEPSGGNYARVEVVNSKTNWTDAAESKLFNKTAIVFPTSSAGWGTLRTLFISNDSTASDPENFFWYATLSPAIVVPINTTVSFEPNTVMIALTHLIGELS
jgi:hypothetical protein